MADHSGNVEHRSMKANNTDWTAPRVNQDWRDDELMLAVAWLKSFVPRKEMEQGESNPCFSLESAKSIRSVTLSVSSVAIGVERTYRRQPISVANDLGCVKMPSHLAQSSEG